MRLVTVNPQYQQITEETCLCCENADTDTMVNMLATQADDGIVCVWQLVEKIHCKVEVVKNHYSVTEKGEVIPK